MTTSAPLTGAILGLGNIGFGFNADRKRRGVWTHERAFARSGVVKLVAAADPDEAMRRRFAKARPDAVVYARAEELLARHRPQFVSVCAPTAHHAALVTRIVASGAKAVFCEKPLAATPTEARKLVTLCRRARVALGVNHTRRWDPEFARAAALVRAGRIGEVRSVVARYPGHVFNVGTHLIDALAFVTGLAPRRAWGIGDSPAGDPHVSGTLVLEGGVACALACHGVKEDLVFELDVLGAEGRLRIVENGFRTILERFTASRRYSGYRELAPASPGPRQGADRFVEAVRDLAACASDPRRRPACSGEDGYYALAAAWALKESARRGGRPVDIEPI